MEENTLQPIDGKNVRKRSRKTKSDSDRNYFGAREEAAFAKYVQSDDVIERSRIFAEILYPAFTKMIESIIRRYYLFVPSENFEDTFHDVMSFLVTKVNNFNTESNYKAYSYCGTICRHYLILKKTQGTKYRNRHVSYDIEFSQPERDDRVEEHVSIDDMNFNTELIKNMTNEIKKTLDEKNEIELTQNERKVGSALVQIFGNWETILKQLGTRKFNKASILYFIKEYTLLSTAEIRNAMKRYRCLYDETKKRLIDL